MCNIDMLKDINRFSEWKTIERINKGWSEDIKFYLEDIHGNKYILRISNIYLYEKRKSEYEYLKELSRFGLNMSIPVEFGLCNNENNVYMLLEWIEGKDAIEILPRLSKQEQYELGIEAGKILKQIHSIKPNLPQELWEDKFKKKINSGIIAYQKSDYPIPYDKDIINYIKQNEIYLKGRENTFQHGDYHLGNMIITSDNKLGIIDFNRCSFGDPWEEYDRFIFSWDNSIDFANGQIHGYFNNMVPDEFFRLMCFYNAINSLVSITWAIQFGETEIKVSLSNIEKYYKVYNSYNNHIPDWYEEPKRKNIGK